MASSSKTHISSYVFSLVLLFSSLHIHARDGKFFDKLTHSSPSSSPSPAPVEPETQNGYGLFGRDENGTPSDGLVGDRYPNYNTGYTNTNNNEEITGESLMPTTTNNNNYYNSGNERQGTSESWIMDNGKYYYGSNTGESLMSSNDDDVNGYAATYNTDLYRPERQRSSGDNYVGGYETEQKDTDYYGNDVKYEFESMEEYDKYQEKKKKNGGYWP